MRTLRLLVAFWIWAVSPAWALPSDDLVKALAAIQSRTEDGNSRIWMDERNRVALLDLLYEVRTNRELARLKDLTPGPAGIFIQELDATLSTMLGLWAELPDFCYSYRNRGKVDLLDLADAQEADNVFRNECVTFITTTLKSLGYSPDEISEEIKKFRTPRGLLFLAFDKVRVKAKETMKAVKENPPFQPPAPTKKP